MSKYFLKYSFVFISILLLTHLDACAQQIGTEKNISLSIPIQTDDGWQVGTLSQARIDSVKLLNLLKKINDKEYTGLNSILIVKNNKLVLEKYFPGYDFEYTAKELKGPYTDYNKNTIHNLASVTKSVTGLLAGIAIDKGYIKGVHEKVESFFPQDSSFFTGDKKNIEIFNLLTMSSGLQWNENDIPYTNLKNDIIQLFIVSDPVKFIISKPSIAPPGTKFYYNGGGTNLVGKIIQLKSGMRLDEFAKANLFDPLGITQYKWVFIKPDFVYCSGDLRLRPRDMAKLGSLVLNNGKWNGRQIVSSEWINEMTKKSVSFNKTEGYGYQWWLKDFCLGKDTVKVISAQGWGGQYICVMPSINSVVVFTAENYLTRNYENEILNRYIFPAIIPGYDYDYGSIEKSTPLPDSINIMQPAKDTAPSLIPFTGEWYGMWEYSLPCRLIVESINNKEAHVIYSWPDHPNGYFKKGWIKATASVDSTGAIHFETADAKWDYRYEKNEDVLIGNYKNQYVNDRAVMKRKR